MLFMLLAAFSGVVFFLVKNINDDIPDSGQVAVVSNRNIPVVSSMDLIDFAKKKSAVLLTTPESILGGYFPVTDEMKNKEGQDTEVEVSKENAFDFAKVKSCRINPRTKNIKLQFSMEEIPKSDDDRLYLFEMKTFEQGHDSNYISTSNKWSEGCFIFEFSLPRLYDKYVIAIKQNDSFLDISRAYYVTNPEAVAQYQYSYPKAASKKGLIVDPAKLSGNSLSDLGVKQAAYNIPIGYILGRTSNGNWPTIHYNYNGRTYEFNGQRIAEFDIVFKALSKRGIVTTAVLLNNYNGRYPQMIHPNARNGHAPYYMFNASDEEGVDYLAATVSFLAKRYSGTEHGQVVNWVVGNEVNARSAWNYMDYCPVDEYTKAYVQAYRVCYSAIKSVNANARVYMCLDQMWDRNLKSTDSYDAKDVLDSFNRMIVNHGNIDYGIAHHPYPVPLTWPKFWAMPANYARMNLVKDSVNTPYITVQNLHVLTDYIQQDSFLNDRGEVRSVLINEIGFGSDHGETLQAAAYAYAYYIVDANQHVDGFILNKQSDMGAEISQGLSLGLDRTNGSHKYIYNVFKNIDSPNGHESTAFAKELIGISDWSQVITGH